jgi:hypothetical protein
MRSDVCRRAYSDLVRCGAGCQVTYHLNEEKAEDVVNEAVEQIAYADRILLNKTDLVRAAAAAAAGFCLLLLIQLLLLPLFCCCRC